MRVVVNRAHFTLVFKNNKENRNNFLCINLVLISDYICHRPLRASTATVEEPRPVTAAALPSQPTASTPTGQSTRQSTTAGSGADASGSIQLSDLQNILSNMKG